MSGRRRTSEDDKNDAENFELILGLIFIAILLAGLGSCVFGPDEEAPADIDSAALADAAAAKVAGQASTSSGSFPCLSAWDGAQPKVKEHVKDKMKDPSSFEHVETRVAATARPDHFAIIMTYRGKNSFGAIETEEFSGVYDVNTCEVL